MNIDKVDKYISYVPNLPQRIVQRDGFNAFIHYGINTFAGQEWSDGKADPSMFNPTGQDTDQWCKILKETGVKSVILTAKHHDGFCLWQTKTTHYSVASSPYQGGKGDVVKELSQSCAKYGLKFGFYLSPWDRNNEHYGINPSKYNDIYCQQLTELLTNYGEVYFVWMDGACGAHQDGKPKQVYDFNRYYQIIRELAPKACISNCGPDVRWVGNEGGYARKSEWNVLPHFAFDTQTISDKSQKEDNGEFAKKGIDIISEDLGSRSFLDSYDQFIWYPAEVDVSIRPGWFYHKSQDGLLRSLNNLMHIYYTSVGGNSLLLLNVPPDKRGLINENDAARLKAMGTAIKSAFAQRVRLNVLDAPPQEGGNIIDNVNSLSCDPITYYADSYYTPKDEAASYTIKASFDTVYNIDKVRLIEDVRFSQRVESFKIYAACKGKTKLVYNGTVIGYNRIALFKKAYKADGIIIVIDKCRRKPYIEHISVYQTDGFIPKPPFFSLLTIALHRLSYKMYVKWEEKKAKQPK